MGRKSKYRTRPDGTKETTRTYTHFGLADFSGKKHFYGKTDEDIDGKIDAFEKSLNSVSVVKTTISEVIDDWWEEKYKTLSPNSMTSFVAKKKEIDEEFGDIPADELTVQQIYNWLKKKAAQGYAQRGLNDRKSVLNQILDHAIVMGLISVNPCVSVPTVKGKPPKKRHGAAEDDIALIEAHKEDSIITRLFYFLLYTGCRVGEAAVLQEKDIDRSNHTAVIYKDLAYDGQTPLVKESAKTEAGMRTIDLYDNVLAILPTYKDKDTYVFFPKGLPRKSPYETALRRGRKAIGITATAHQLRHSYASLMHSAEVDVKDAQTLLGHSSIVLTQDVYTEIERQHSTKVREKVNKYVMEVRLGEIKKCPHCGSIYLRAEDGHEFTYCPDCGNIL